MENLFLVVGLGNPGREYANTRHNAGFLLVEKLAKDWNTNWTAERKFHSQLAKYDLPGCKLILCRPQTFMNASGEAVRTVVDFFRVSPGRTLLVVDDADLPFGEIRLRAGGSSGGHHGLESVEEHLGTREFPRLRIGIGRKDRTRQIANYVLSPFLNADADLLEKILERAAKQVECWAREGIGKAMSQFNGTINKEEKGTEQ